MLYPQGQQGKYDFHTTEEVSEAQRGLSRLASKWALPPLGALTLRWVMGERWQEHPGRGLRPLAPGPIICVQAPVLLQLRGLCPGQVRILGRKEPLGDIRIQRNGKWGICKGWREHEKTFWRCQLLRWGLKDEE